MLHAVHYPRDLIADRVRFSPADQAQIAQCRGAHNRLGFAYQLGFLRLTGRFPAQQPLELLDDLLGFVAHEVALDPALIQDYAQRRQTVSEHQQFLTLYLGFRPFGPAERDALGRFVRDEALRLESTPALVAQAEAFLRDHTILVPASSTLHRVVGEQRALARQQLYVRLLAGLPSSMPADLEVLVQVEETPYSPLHALKAPPGLPSPRALLRLIAKLDQIQATQVLTLHLTWLNPNLQKALAQHVWQASAHRLRGLPAPQRYTVLVCFLTQTYRDTLDQLVDMYSQVVTATYRRAQHDLDTVVKKEAVFASNTSSISITELMTATKRPERFHFGNGLAPQPGLPPRLDGWIQIWKIFVVLGSKLYSEWRIPLPALITCTSPASVRPSLPRLSRCVIAPCRT